MRIHFALNANGTPESRLADVEIHFEEGLLSGLKLVGCSVWRSKKGDEPTILVPSRSYATAGGVRYYELLRPSDEGPGMSATADQKKALKLFKDYIREEFSKIAALPPVVKKAKTKKKAKKIEAPPPPVMPPQLGNTGVCEE